MKKNDNINLEPDNNCKNVVYCPYIKAPVKMCHLCNMERNYNLQNGQNEFYQSFRNENFDEPIVGFKAVDIKELQD